MQILQYYSSLPTSFCVFVCVHACKCVPVCTLDLLGCVISGIRPNLALSVLIQE